VLVQGVSVENPAAASGAPRPAQSSAHAAAKWPAVYLQLAPRCHASGWSVSWSDCRRRAGPRSVPERRRWRSKRRKTKKKEWIINVIPLQVSKRIPLLVQSKGDKEQNWRLSTRLVMIFFSLFLINNNAHTSLRFQSKSLLLKVHYFAISSSEDCNQLKHLIYIYGSVYIYIHMYIYIYTTVQKFGVIQTISCLPWKLTFIYQMNWKLKRRYRQDIDKVRNNDYYLKY